MYLCIYLSIYLSIYIYTYIDIDICVCVSVCVYVYAYKRRCPASPAPTSPAALEGRLADQTSSSSSDGSGGAPGKRETSRKLESALAGGCAPRPEPEPGRARPTVRPRPPLALSRPAPRLGGAGRAAEGGLTRCCAGGPCPAP